MADKERPMLHVIGEDLVLSSELPSTLETWRFTRQGLEYDLVAVFGSQSTGKSTLLNLLFGTGFDVMSDKARRQTTKDAATGRGPIGLWLSPANDERILVLDVEGTDGRERGENQGMERKSALFSLATASVMIVNLFESDVGRYNGANYGLLKTVFEVNLKLFQSHGSSKTLLLFAVRDHAITPMEGLEAILREDMARIFSELSKPQGLEGTTLDTYFDLAFVGLPHKIYEPDKFSSAVSELRSRFMDAAHPRYLLNPQYRKRVPADGFAHYVAGVWDKIVHDRDVNLPTQRQLLAQYRCAEIAKEALTALTEQFAPFKPQLQSGHVVPTLGGQMRDARDAALAHFDERGRSYEATVYEALRLELLSTIHAELYSLYILQLHNIDDVARRAFVRLLDAKLKEAPEAVAAAATAAKEEAFEEFVTIAKATTLEGTAWSYHEVAETLLQGLNDASHERCENELDSLRDKLAGRDEGGCQKSLSTTVADGLADHFAKSAATMWADMQAFLAQTLTAQRALASRKLAGFQLDAARETAVVASLSSAAATVLRERIKAETTDTVLLNRLLRRFEDGFKYDEARRPRVWAPNDDINAVYDAARRRAQNLLDLYRRADLDLDVLALEWGEGEWPQLLTPAHADALWELAGRECDAAYHEAQRSRLQGFASVPVWVWVLLFVFAWNDLMAFITSPVSTAFNLLLFGAVVYGTYFVSQNYQRYDALAHIVRQATETGVAVLQGAATAVVQRMAAAPSEAPPPSMQGRSRATGGSANAREPTATATGAAASTTSATLRRSASRTTSNGN